MKSEKTPPPSLVQDHYTTLEVASMLGLAVRSVQLMVDRNELEAWKTPGGHRRISRASVEQWINARTGASGKTAAVPQAAAHAADGSAPSAPSTRARGSAQILLIEDSIHFQNLVTLLVNQHFPGAVLHTANDGITGLAMYGQIQPDVLIVDILLPGIDGATLITTLRSHPQFARSRLIVVTSLDEQQREPYAFALQGVTVIHKPQLVAELPAALAQTLPAKAA
ncbi:response regulator [Acidovorax sp. 1608163]|uniref:response regulator n=1 Tax=Acidovorax sp. 1608163 TaxID=2478662 RepID=UPI000EF65BF6|nr:response regulator [Acidovorax sp. 1608163]AYM96836.1 response regulator [Acidovorax sp. 1608163]